MNKAFFSSITSHPLAPAADGITFNGVAFGPPSWRFRFELKQGPATVGQLHLSRDQAIGMALSILAMTVTPGGYLTIEERATLERILVGKIVEDRQRALLARYDDGEIDLAELDRLQAEAKETPCTIEWSPWPQGWSKLCAPASDERGSADA
jgi:hypothetical protein